MNKGITILYWSMLVLFTLGMLASSVPSVLRMDVAIAHFTGILHLPEYLLVFTGVLKIVGLVPLYVPGYPRLREWAYAGFAFDLVGAWYCNYMALSFADAFPVIIYLVIMGLLYYADHKRRIPAVA